MRLGRSLTGRAAGVAVASTDCCGVGSCAIIQQLDGWSCCAMGYCHQLRQVTVRATMRVVARLGRVRGAGGSDRGREMIDSFEWSGWSRSRVPRCSESAVTQRSTKKRRHGLQRQSLGIPRTNQSPIPVTTNTKERLLPVSERKVTRPIDKRVDGLVSVVKWLHLQTVRSLQFWAVRFEAENAYCFGSSCKRTARASAHLHQLPQWSMHCRHAYCVLYVPRYAIAWADS